MVRTFAALLLLAACASQAASPGADCDARGLQHLVGQPLPADFAHAGPLRLFQTGDMLTMDYREDRLNIERSPATGLVLSVRCG